jgi:hypothetical protein
MNRRLTPFLLISALLLSANAMAATTAPKFKIKNNSPVALIDDASATAIWLENLPAKLAKPYPVKKWGYLSEVNGGFDDHKVCRCRARNDGAGEWQELYLCAKKDCRNTRVTSGCDGRAMQCLSQDKIERSRTCYRGIFRVNLCFEIFIRFKKTGAMIILAPVFYFKKTAAKVASASVRMIVIG